MERNGPKVLNDSDQTPVTPERSDSYLYTQADTITSMPILTAAILDPEVSHTNVISKARNKFVFLKKAVSVDVGKKNDIITVAFNAPDPAEATIVVDAIVKAYVDYVARSHKGTTSEILKVLTDEKVRHDADLSRQQSELLVFKENNGNVFFKTDKGTIIMQDLATVSDEITKAKLLVAQAGAQLAEGNSKTHMADQYRVALARLENFQKVYDHLEEQANALNAKTAEYEKLLAEIDRTQKVVDLLDARIKELNVTQDARPLNISILEVPHADSSPSFPRPMLTLVGAFVIGTMLGLVAALIREWMDQRVRSVDDVNHALGLSVLGVLPEVAGVNGRAGNRELELAPMSESAEAFRSLRTAIYLGLPDASTSTLLVTSPNAGEGKSTTASNLAISLAQTGKRTLLIDADLRKPVQHETFGLSRTNGLSDVIARGELLESVLKPTRVSNLDVLTCGSLVQNPAEILNDAAFEELLATLCERYDKIVIDSPPVLPVADASILSARCDVTVLVLRAEKSTKKGSEYACERLQNVGGTIFGAVVNGVTRNNRGYGGYEQYYQHADYTQDPEERAVALIKAESHALARTGGN